MTQANTGRRALLRLSLGGMLLTQPLMETLASASSSISVLEAGARGDGVHDDTDAFQAAIDQAAKAQGTVEVPRGRYLIDPERSVRLRSHTALRMAPDAVLVAKPNAAARAYVLLVEGAVDVDVSGGQIQGERDAHLGSAGEWGHGLMIRGSSHVTVRNITISRCWGDGISIGGLAKTGEEGRPSTDVLIDNVRCRGNRRQGLTIGRSRRVRVFDSEFSDTQGTKPEYGIDIEPDRPGRADDVVIERCRISGNRGGGIQIYNRAGNVEVRDCTIEANGYGIYTVAAEEGVIAGNTVRNNRHAGVALRGKTHGFRVEANRFSGNNSDLRLSPQARRAARVHVQLGYDSQDNAISSNQYD
ncbi:right-handed parallel beta-helix repeat-containing protein [Lysobacter terrae]